MNKRYDRLMFSIASVFAGYDFMKEIAIQQENVILGIVDLLIFLSSAVMWLDLSGIRKNLINRNYNVDNNTHVDALGMVIVLYLFVEAVI